MLPPEALFMALINNVAVIFAIWNHVQAETSHTVDVHHDQSSNATVNIDFKFDAGKAPYRIRLCLEFR